VLSTAYLGRVDQHSVEMLKNPLPEFAEEYALSPRPSKTRLHRLLKKDLEKWENKEVVADIATQNFMNAHHFGQNVYFGVDIDKNALEKGIDSISDDDCHTAFISAPVSEGKISEFRSKHQKHKIAVEGNILDFNLFPSNSLDVITSTNTLICNHIDSAKYYSIIESFCNYIDKDGHLYLNLADDDFTNDIHRYLLSEFEKVGVIGYGNKISNKYEKYLESEEGSPSLSDNTALHYGQMGISLILSKIELIHSENTTGSYIRCERKL
jgi:hypothetical protein